jgi:hypothetical protein
VKRIHKSLLWAAVLFGGGVGFGLYVLKKDVKTPEERYRLEALDRRLFKEEFGLVHVRSGELMTRGTTIAFSLDGDSWKINSPVVWPGDKAAIDDAINQMVAVQIDPETRVEEPDDAVLGSWALGKPRTRLTLDTAKGEFSLLVGPKNAIKDMYPITDGARRAAGLSTPEFYWALDKPLADYRDRRIFPFPPEEIEKVLRRAHDGSGFLLAREGDGFVLFDAEGKKKEKADIDRAEIFLVALTKRLSIGRFLTDDYSEQHAKEHGLDQAILLEVTSKTGKTVRAFVGKIFETGDQKGTAVMHLDGTRTVVEVPDFVQDEVAKTKGDLEDRTIARFDRKSVAKVELLQGTEEIVVEKSGDEWNVTSPKKAPARTWKMDGFVRAFSRLKAERFHREDASPAELREWLLDPPSRRFKFFDGKGALLGDVRIGKYYAEKEIFAMKDGEKRVGVVADTRLTTVPKNLDDLLDPDRIQ